MIQSLQNSYSGSIFEQNEPFLPAILRQVSMILLLCSLQVDIIMVISLYHTISKENKFQADMCTHVTLILSLLYLSNK